MQTRLDIGVPVCHGERFLRRTLESLLARTFILAGRALTVRRERPAA